ncbi:MAG: substrate-binding domain-containing protein [Thermodesulfobacteriota bacterium]
MKPTPRIPPQRRLILLIVCSLAGISAFWIPAAFPEENKTGDVIIIGHQNLPIDSLALNDLKLIYKGEKTLWPDDQPILFVTLPGGDVHDMFVTTYLRKTPSQYSRYWKKLIFSGRGFPPRALKNEAGVVSYVRKTPGAIGYVSRQTKLAGVKRIHILEGE